VKEEGENRLKLVQEKNRAEMLQTLSNKLAKYLSPQIYQSIFSGEKDVTLTSSRKKLTIFFSDIVGFTSTTDQMESEDLTQLLNSYLSEMTAIALRYGATIDKYIGDAIMIFFGDPHSQGVAEDARLCGNGDSDAEACARASGRVAGGRYTSPQHPRRHPYRLLHGRQLRY